MTTKPTDPLAEMARRIAELEQANAQLKEAASRTQAMSMSVSSKGAVSVYGLGRFPVTLYPAQFERLLAKAQDILAFISEGRRLGAFGSETKEATFVQPNGLPLKFVAKVAKDTAKAPAKGNGNGAL